jgi:hypothetical protein
MRVVLAHLSGPNPRPVELPPQIKFALGLGDQVSRYEVPMDS